MFVTNPVLSPNQGYVEDIDEHGNHYLRKVENETVSIQEILAENALLKSQLKAQSDRTDFLEDCMAELAIQAYQ